MGNLWGPLGSGHCPITQRLSKPLFMLGAVRAILGNLYQENRQKGPALWLTVFGRVLRAWRKGSNMPLGQKEHMWPFLPRYTRLVPMALTCIGGSLTHTHSAVRETEAERDVMLLAQVTQAGESARMSTLVSLTPSPAFFSFHSIPWKRGGR